MTQGNQRPKDEGSGGNNDMPFGVSAMESETEADDDEDEEEPENNLSTPAFERSKLKQILAQHGGQVLGQFPGDKDKIPENLIVLSDRSCRTMTYLLAIAYGFQRVNFLWVLNSVSAKNLLPVSNYLLPVGFSSVLNKDVEQHEVGPLRDIFKDLHILVSKTCEH